jgi:hypothetical protein
MAKRVNHIFPECYVDTNILKTLLQVDGVNHQYGCSRVMAKMETGRFADGFAIGIMDDDKKKTYDYQDFRELCSSEHLVLMKHKTKHHYLILVCKAAEDFLLACAHELGLNMADYQLPDTLEGLKDVTKNNDSDREPRIKKLVNALRESSEMARLERTVYYLHEKQFDVKVDELVDVFG